LLGTPKFSEKKSMKSWEYASPKLPKYGLKKLFVPSIEPSGNDLLNKMMTIDS